MVLKGIEFAMILKILKNVKGSALVLVVIAMVILMILGGGLLTISYGVRYHASRIQNEAIAMLAAEAGYEKAVFWMGQQSDMAYVMRGGGHLTDSVVFSNSGCNYDISLFSFKGSRPIYRIISNGYCGGFRRTVDVLVLQAIGGWDMGLCRIPDSSSSTRPVYFATGEIIDMPIHINKANDNPDVADIFISGDPQFLQTVSMGESRRTGGGSDKYGGVMGVFDSGIDFDQPNSKITDEASVQTKINRFESSTKGAYSFTPVAKAVLPVKPDLSALPATQLEFFVDSTGAGNVRITNNCTVRGFMRSQDSMTNDFMIKPGTNGSQFQRYPIYSYHYMPSNADVTGERVTRTIDSTYVTQSIGGAESEPGGQLFVNGNVIIGGDNALNNNWQVVKGRITVVATGNIWIADNIVLDGPHDAKGMPSTTDNPNALGLIAQGVIKVVDPGMANVDGSPPAISNSTYVPVCMPDPARRKTAARPDGCGGFRDCRRRRLGC